MADNTTKANLESLHSSGAQLTQWADESQGLFRSGHSAIEEASTGWIGSSAAALDEALEKLRNSANALLGGLDNHSSGMHTTATAFHTAGLGVDPKTSQFPDPRDIKPRAGTPTGETITGEVAGDSKLFTGLRIAGRAATPVAAGLTVFDDYQQVHNGQETVPQAVGHSTGMIGGMTGGAEAGAAIGTFIGPEGTAIGGVVGGLVGGISGAVAGGKVGKWIGGLL